MSTESLQGLSKSINNYFAPFSAEIRAAWVAGQAYIALGTGHVAAAMGES